MAITAAPTKGVNETHALPVYPRSSCRLSVKRLATVLRTYKKMQLSR
jgi:hypothetical protein